MRTHLNMNIYTYIGYWTYTHTPSHAHICKHTQTLACRYTRAYAYADTYTSQRYSVLYQAPIPIPNLSQTPRLTLSCPTFPPDLMPWQN